MNKTPKEILEELKEQVGENDCISNLLNELDTCLEDKCVEIETYLNKQYNIKNDDTLSSILLGESQPMYLYWVSAIINDNGKIVNIALSAGLPNYEKALESIEFWKEHYTVISAWIDIFDKNDKKETIYHECFVDSFGKIKK